MGEKKIVSKSIAIVLGVLCILLLVGMVGEVIYFNNAYNNYRSINTHTNSDYDSLNSQLAEANATILRLNNQLATIQSELTNNATKVTDLTKQITDLKTQIANANKKLTTLTDYYNSLLYVINTENHDLAIELTAANNQITSLQNQVNTLTAIGNLNVSTVWINNQTVSQQAGTYTTWSESASYAGYISIQVSSSTSSTYANVTYSSHGINYNSQTNVGTSGIAHFPILPSSNITIAVGNGLIIGNATETVTVTYYY
jgi:uncharacterized coiled-coil protein SlyX